jgi:hypothetical protein
LRSLSYDLDPRDAVQIDAVLAERAPLARRLYSLA